MIPDNSIYLKTSSKNMWIILTLKYSQEQSFLTAEIKCHDNFWLEQITEQNIVIIMTCCSHEHEISGIIIKLGWEEHADN